MDPEVSTPDQGLSVVVGCDGSDPGLDGLVLSKGLAKAFGSQVAVIYVYDEELSARSREAARELAEHAGAVLDGARGQVSQARRASFSGAATGLSRPTPARARSQRPSRSARARINKGCGRGHGKRSERSARSCRGRLSALSAPRPAAIAATAGLCRSGSAWAGSPTFEATMPWRSPAGSRAPPAEASSFPRRRRRPARSPSRCMGAWPRLGGADRAFERAGSERARAPWLRTAADGAVRRLSSRVVPEARCPAMVLAAPSGRDEAG